MQLPLTEHEARALYDLLHDVLPELQRETARTESKEFRRLLLDRQALIERLLVDLAAVVEGTTIP